MKTASRLASLVLALTAVTAITGCPAEDGDHNADIGYCERMDSCNLLSGVSSDECVQKVDKYLDDKFDPSERSDWDTVMNSCLDFTTCTLFDSCVKSNGL